VISQLLFTYLDANRVVTGADESTSFVRVTVTAQTPTADKYTGQLATFTYTAEVRVRMR
jgi:hypothetical protein